MGLAEIGLRYALETPQRRAEARRFETIYGPGGFKERELEAREAGYKLNEKELDFREKQLQSQVDQWAVRNKLDWNAQKKGDINAWLSVLNNTMDKHPEMAQRIWDIGLAPHFGEANMQMDKTGDWSVLLEDGTAFIIDTKTGEFKIAQYPTTGKTPKMSDFKTGLSSVLTRWRTGGGQVMVNDDGTLSFGAEEAYANLVQTAQDPKNPRNAEAVQDLQDYSDIWNKMREVMGLEQAGGGLMNVGESFGGEQSRQLDEVTAREFYNQAGGDPEAARELARQQGYIW